MATAKKKLTSASAAVLAKRHLKAFRRKANASSTLADKNRSKPALPPGRRVSKTGKVYYENRINRADGDRRKRV